MSTNPDSFSCTLDNTKAFHVWAWQDPTLNAEMMYLLKVQTGNFSATIRYSFKSTHVPTSISSTPSGYYILGKAAASVEIYYVRQALTFRSTRALEEWLYGSHSACLLWPKDLCTSPVCRMCSCQAPSSEASLRHIQRRTFTSSDQTRLRHPLRDITGWTNLWLLVGQEQTPRIHLIN